MVALMGALVACCGSAAFAQSDRVFTVGNYPVQAAAENAVAAKEKAIAEGQRAAFRSLIKRLVPLSAYKSATGLKGLDPGNMIQGISVRSERNSSTTYRASLDFSFDPQRVRDLLLQRGIPMVDEPAKETAIVLIVQPVGGASGGGGGSVTAAVWREAWTGLDLENGLTPVKLHDRPAALSEDMLKQARSNPEAPLRAISILAKSGQAVIALAEPDAAARRLHVTLTGSDGVGPFVLRRTWRLDTADPGYTAELAAVVALGVIEGRWKTQNARPAAPLAPTGLVREPVQITVEFRSAQEWGGIRRQMAELPGVSDFTIGGVSGTMADVALRFPGGGPALADSLGAVGIDLRPMGGAWLARSRL